MEISATTMTHNEQSNHGFLIPSIVCLAACLFFLYEFVLQVSPNVMTFQLMRDLKVDAAQLGIISGSYYIAYSLMQIPAGMLYDRYGPRTLLTIATLVCASGALAFGLTSSMFTASMGRFLMGGGSAFAFIGCLVLVARWFPTRYFALLAGIVQLMSSVGALIGEIPLAEAVTHLGWRPTITTLGYAGAVIAIIIWLVVRDSPSSVRVKKPGQPQADVLKRLLKVIKKSQTWFVFVYSFTSWAPIIVFAALWGVPFLVTAYHISETQASSAISMVWLSIGLGSPFLGWLSDRIGLRRLPLSLCSFIGLVSVSFVLLAPDFPFWVMYPLLFLFGLAASAQTLSFAVVKDNNKPTRVGTAIGFNNVAVVCGGILFQPLVGFFLRAGWDGAMSEGAPVYAVEDYRLALLILPACSLLGLIVSVFFLKETYCRPTYQK